MSSHAPHIVTIALIAACFSLLGVRDAHAQSEALEGIFDQADGELEGYGGSYILGLSAVYSHRTHFDVDNDPNDSPGNTYGVLLEGAVMPFRTLFGAQSGVEASVGLGFPALGTFYGGLRGNLGIMITPIPLGPLHLSVAAGAAFGGHRHLYLKPRVLLNFRALALEASYTWNPPKASRVWDQGGPPGTHGIGSKKLRGQLWFQLEEPDGDVAVHAVHLFVEQATLSTPAPEILVQKQILEGTYWSGGLGASF